MNQDNIDGELINNIINCSNETCDVAIALKKLIEIVVTADIEDYFDDEDDDFLDKQKDAKILLFKLTAKYMENKVKQNEK